MTATSEAPTLDAAITAYLTAIKRRETTHRTYSGALTVFLRDFAPTLDSPPATTTDLPTDILARFYDWLRGEAAHDYAPLTVRTYLAALRALLRHLSARDQLAPFFSLAQASHILNERMTLGDRVRYPAVEHVTTLPQLVTFYDDIPPRPTINNRRGWQQYLIQLRNRALLYTLFATAGRISEVLALTVADVSFGRARTAAVTGKGDKPRTLRFTADAQRAIKDYVNARQEAGEKIQRAPLFVSHGRMQGSALTARQAQNIVKAAAKAHGLAGEVTPHTFRHWRATQLLNDGMPAEMVKDFLGHESITTTTTVYARYLDRTLDAAFDRLSPTVREAQERVEQREEEP